MREKPNPGTMTVALRLLAPALLTFALPWTPAPALPSPATNPEAQITGTRLEIVGGRASETIAVACDAGHVAVNGQRPAGDPLPCAELTELAISAGEGDDTIDATATGPAVFPDLVRRILAGEAGNDQILGSPRHDRLFGGRGADTLVPAEGADSVDGGPGGDTVVDFPGEVVVLTDSLLTGGGGSDALQSVERAELTGTDADDVVTTTSFRGATQVTLEAGADTFTGGPGADTVAGGPGADDLQTRNGNDRLRGDEDDDRLIGGKGTDTIVATTTGTAILTKGGLTGEGTDTLGSIESAELATTGGRINASAFPGPLIAIGSPRNDTLIGGGDDDQFLPGEGDDTVNGKGGLDKLIRLGGSATLSDTEMVGEGIDRLTDVEHAEIQGSAADDLIDSRSFSGRVRARGLGGADRIFGAAGEDDLFGQSGDDLVKGGRGDDRIHGGRGVDTCRGGVGQNVIRACEQTP